MIVCIDGDWFVDVYDEWRYCVLCCGVVFDYGVWVGDDGGGGCWEYVVCD